MGGNSFGDIFRVTTFGESHGRGVGVIVDGVTPGVPLSEQDIQFHLDRRKPGQSDITTPRKESDKIHILSGIFEGKTTGTPIAMTLANEDQRSGDYSDIMKLFRPGHADYTYLKKYGIRDYRGSGRASGRETSGRVAAGAIALKLLEAKGVSITAYTLRAAGIQCAEKDFSIIENNPMRACDMAAAKKMADSVKKLAEEGNSTGGIVECTISGIEPGLGEPVFDKLDAELGKAVLSLGAVKGVEFGAGFGCADMRGLEHNDHMNKEGFMTNNAGGILGGISTGEDILFRVAVKPTSSINSPQPTITIHGEEVTVRTEGRHDPCICPRIVPVVESMAALVLIDMYKKQAALFA